MEEKRKKRKVMWRGVTPLHSRQRRPCKTFTKRAVKAILFIALLDLQLSYVLAFLGREQIAENLSSDITKVIIGTILGYLAKAFFETKEQEKVRLQEEEWRNGE